MQNFPLSERELELLKLIATGASNKEISSTLFISVNTVKVHLRNIFTKLDVSSRTEAAMWAVQNGLVETGEIRDGTEESGDSENLEQQRIGWFGKLSPGIRLFLLSGITIILILTGFGVSQIFRQPSPTPIPAEVPDEASLEESRWKQLADMPTARAGLAAAAYDNDIYAIAGEGVDGVQDVNEVYNPRTDNWEILTPKPVPVADVHAGVVGGRIFVPGGRLESGEVTDTLEIYDPRLDSWSVGSRMPKKMSAYALATYEGKIYLFGGWDGVRYLDSTYVYDPDDDVWEKRTPMLTARGFAGAAEAGGKIYVIGGFDGERALDVNEVYDVVLEGGEGVWSVSVPMPEGRYGMGVVYIGEKSLIIGGEYNSGVIENSLELIDQNKNWNRFSNPSDASLGKKVGVVAYVNQFYCLGGLLDNIPSSNTQAYTVFYSVMLPYIEQ